MKKKLSNSIDLNQIAELFDIPGSDKFIDLNTDNVWEAGDYALKEALKRGSSEVDAEKARDAAEMEAGDDAFREYHGAVLSAAEVAFEHIGVMLTPKRKGEKHPFEFKVDPIKSWEDAAEKIRDVINGEGYFGFSSLKEFLSSGPYTAREAVLGHLHYANVYHEVYGTTSPERQYESAFR